MLTNLSVDVSTTDLLEALPDGAIWLVAAAEANGQALTFRVAHINSVARTVWQRSNAAVGTEDNRSEVGWPWLTELREVLGQVHQSKQPQDCVCWDETVARWLDIHVSRLGNGILLLVRQTRTEKREDELINSTRPDLQAIIDFSQTGIFVFTPVYDEHGKHVDFRFAAVNRMVANLVGQTPDVLTGAVASNWFVSYRETGLFDRYKHTFDTGESQRFDIYYNVDDFDVWFDVHCLKIDNAVLVNFTDLTQLKQAQQALENQALDKQQQAALLNGVLDGSDSGVIAFDAIRDPARANEIVDFRFIIANKASVRLLGKRLDEMVGQKLLDVFPGNKETGLFDLYKRTTETGETSRMEVYYNHDGLDFWLAITAQQLGDGFVVTFTDISAIKQASQAAEAYAEELVTAFDTSQTGMFLFTPVHDAHGEVVDFRFRVANRQLGSYVGQPPAALIGELGSRWFPDYMTNGLFETYRKAYLTGRTQRFNFHYEGSGIDVWLDIMASKLGDQVLVTFTDFTNLKRLHQQLEQSIANLRQSNADLERFAYVASHDLQEPLRKIKSFGDLLVNHYADQLDEGGGSLIERMQAAAERMSVLIRDLLAYSRLSTKQVSSKPVNLDQVLNRVLDDLDLPLTESKAVVHAGYLPTLPGDETQLQQVLQNLLANAIKFRRPNQQPIIWLNSQLISAAELPHTVRPARRASHYHRLTIQDNGIGFDEQHADRIFQVFQRLHGRSQYEGTGIGLAIVQKVVENHGGVIVASSPPGEGATFTVYLPE